MKMPKVGETWMRRSFTGDREVKILELLDDTDGRLYFVSYYSEGLRRRSGETVHFGGLYPILEKVVSYQLMYSTEDGHVSRLVTSSTVEGLRLGCVVTKDLNRYTSWIQRTEVTGDKVEVFVQRVLPKV